MLSRLAEWPRWRLTDLRQSNSTNWLRRCVIFSATELVDARQTQSKKVNLGAKVSGDYQSY